jgi:hypothetical protein
MAKEDLRAAGVEDIQFFTDVDKKWDKGDSTITATYPGWYFDQQLAEKKEEYRQRTRKPADDEIVSDVDPEYLNETRALATKIKALEEARPKLNGAQTTFLKKAVSELECGISESMFSYDDMHFGEASAHEELKRQLNPCIKIDKRLATSLNLKSYKGGMVSRDDATIATQIMNKALGETSNIERLRRKDLTCRTRRVTPFTGDGEFMETPDGRESASTATP